jgi:hypothetical protein
MMRVFVEGVGLLGPGLAGWETSRAVLAGVVPYVIEKIVIPASNLLPPTERRRVGVPVKLALAVGSEAFAPTARDRACTATVFASSSGDGDNVHQICGALASTQRDVSPTRFHNSVHNAPAGYWGIAVGCREASTSLACHDDSFAAGMLEAVAQVVATNAPVALIAYDHPYPEPLHTVRPLIADFAVAMVFAPERTQHTLAELEIQYKERVGEASCMCDQGLEALRIGSPAARSLPLLAAMAGTGDATLAVAYGSEARLMIAVFPASAVSHSA